MGRPDELREQLFRKALIVTTLAPLAEPEGVFGSARGVESWRKDGSGAYVVAVADPRVAAPEITRSLVAAGADVLSISESRHSLEDVYLELIDEDVGAQGGATMSWTRIRAIFVKELRDYRRNRFIMVTMAITPVVFIVVPIVDIFVLPAVHSSAALDQRIGLSLLYMLIIPAVVPATLAGFSVVGERAQETLEPVLTTPIRSEEFLLGKALAALFQRW